MSVFRVEKTKNYTIMSNHHLKNPSLTLKAKGLLSLMLSLPDDWDYTLAGLAKISLEKVDAIRTAVQELEREGYVTRDQQRAENGRFGGADYVIHEMPMKGLPLDESIPQKGKNTAMKAKNAEKQRFSPILENPTTVAFEDGGPMLDYPTSEKPTSGNPMQLNKELQNKDLTKKESIPFRSFQPARAGRDGKGTETADIDYYKTKVKENIRYDALVEAEGDADMVDGIVDLILETVCSSRKTFRISGDEFPAEFVKEKFMQLDYSHVGFVFECLSKNTTAIKNIKKYLLACLFNAPSTIAPYYNSLVAHDIATGKLRL